jgi:hypothetical protein
MSGDALLTERTMRIMVTPEFASRLKRGERLVNVHEIPWAMIMDCERQSQENHGQSLDKISSRGGFDASEAVAVLSGLSYRALGGMSEEAAHRVLYSMKVMFNRGQRVAEARSRPLSGTADGRG